MTDDEIELILRGENKRAIIEAVRCMSYRQLRDYLVRCYSGLSRCGLHTLQFLQGIWLANPVSYRSSSISDWDALVVPPTDVVGRFCRCGASRNTHQGEACDLG